MTIVVGIFNTQSCLEIPFLIFFCQIDIDCIYIFMINKIIGLGCIRNIFVLAVTS